MITFLGRNTFLYLFMKVTFKFDNCLLKKHIIDNVKKE